MNKIGILDAGIVAVLGYVIVFFGLILLMAVVVGLGQIFVAQEKKTKTAPAASTSAPAPTVAAAPQPTAPGAAGQLKLHNVEPKTAALLMAIVANKLQKPLNELRFLSIREVTPSAEGTEGSYQGGQGQ